MKKRTNTIQNSRKKQSYSSFKKNMIGSGDGSNVGLLTLPNDPLIEEISYNGYPDFMSFCKINKKLSDLCQKKDFWRLMYNKDFSDCGLDLHNDNYYLKYRLCAMLTRLKQGLNYQGSISELFNSTDLDLSNKGISIIPPEIGVLINLRTLDFSDNNIKTIPPEIGLLTNLEAFSIVDGQISKIPPEIGQLINLQELYLIFNHIKTIPPEIGSLINLKELELGHNDIKTIPPEITLLSDLVFLHLNNNQISEIPLEIGEMENLRLLDLRSNNISNPKEFLSLKMPHLKVNL
jgi:Leucine-rich repeat (LRR) protein